MSMSRRTLLKSGAAAVAAGALGAPAIAQPARVLRFVPHADLPNLDPVLAPQYIVRNGSALIYDTLYGVDSNMVPQPQMAAGHEVSDDGLVWRFRLRDGLRFHDGEPVLSRDVIASFKRAMPRDPIGRLLASRLEEMVVEDDSTFSIRLTEAFPQLLFAMGKPSPWFVMPERIAQTDPNQQIDEYVGSGPMRFLRGDTVQGSRAVFERFDDYVPRDEAPSWLAGGKHVNFDRVEWVILPDPATSVAALQGGEVDWVEQPLADLVPLLQSSDRISVDIADPLGNVGILRVNHLHPPFDNVLVRRALQMAINQEDYMRAVVGNDEALWRTLPSFFAPGTPAFSEAGGEVVAGPADIDAARRLLEEAGYDGTPVVVMVGADIPANSAMGQVTADVLGKLGMAIDYVSTDWGTIGQRRASRESPQNGGWNILHTWSAGGETAFPPAYTPIRTDGEGWFGWPKSEEVEARISDWLEAEPEAQQAASDELNREAMDFVVHIPLGLFRSYQAWNSSLTGVSSGPLPIVWGVDRA